MSANKTIELFWMIDFAFSEKSRDTRYETDFKSFLVLAKKNPPNNVSDYDHRPNAMFCK